MRRMRADARAALRAAYGGAASAALRGAARRRVRPQALARLACGFAQLPAVYAALEAAGASRLEESYSADGASVQLRVRCDAAAAPGLDAALADATAGRVRLQPEAGDAAQQGE
jgi:putative IMPACT (imprinted ancient) family translation regulator